MSRGPHGAPLRIRLTRLSIDRHRLELERGAGRSESVELETRSLLRHDLAHFALEEAAGLTDGFWGRVAAGCSLSELAGRDGALPMAGVNLEIEQVVAMLQGPLASDTEPEQAHAHLVQMLAWQDAAPPPWLTADVMTRAAARLRALLGRWRATPFHGTLELSWPSAAGPPPRSETDPQPPRRS